MWLPATDNAFHVGYALAYHADRREGLPMLKTLEKGKRADLIAVAGDPLADVGNLADTARIRPVLKDGAIAVRR
jgi:hypothetical protein